MLELKSLGKDLEVMMEGLSVNLKPYIEKSERMLGGLNAEVTSERLYDTLTKNALENIDEANTEWTYVASRILLADLYQKAAKNRGYDATKKYGSFYNLINILVDKGIYTKDLLNKYTKEEIEYLGSKIDAEKDNLFNYLGLYTLSTRYLATDYEKNVYELPQERWMIIAMHLMQGEDIDERLDLVLESYWALSNLYMTVATPTMNNAGKTYGQLSSCFIDSVEDSLQSIYDVNSDVAKLSKNGGGIGVKRMRHYKVICS